MKKAFDMVFNMFSTKHAMEYGTGFPKLDFLSYTKKWCPNQNHTFQLDGVALAVWNLYVWK